MKITKKIKDETHEFLIPASRAPSSLLLVELALLNLLVFIFINPFGAPLAVAPPPVALGVGVTSPWTGEMGAIGSDWEAANESDRRDIDVAFIPITY